MVLLIAYDLHNPQRDYASVTQAIKDMSANWAHVEGSVWLVDVLIGTQDAMNLVRSAGDSNDTVFVSRLQHDWWSVNLSEAVIGWLKDPARRW